ncbi:hypothetical protein QYM36_018557, partial [Artemia franciscana]
MAVVARFWCPQLKRVCNRLLGLVEVPSATAQIMKGEVDKLLSVRNIPKENCIGFGWDNASVNMGEVTGLKALVKIDNPYVIVVGCVCHSLALCASNASKEIPLEFDEFVRDVYNYIQHSPKRIAAYAGTVRVPAPCQYAHKIELVVGESIHREPSEALAERL